MKTNSFWSYQSAHQLRTYLTCRMPRFSARKSSLNSYRPVCAAKFCGQRRKKKNLIRSKNFLGRLDGRIT